MNIAHMNARQCSYVWNMWDKATRADARRITGRDDRSAYGILAAMACFAINRAAWLHSTTEQARYAYLHAMWHSEEQIPEDIRFRFGIRTPMRFNAGGTL